MGWMDRLGDVAGGLKDAVQAPFGLVMDLTWAPLTGDEYEGWRERIWGSLGDRGVQFISNAIGPERGLGAAIGGLPEPARLPGRYALSGLNWAYDEGISQPISTLMTMASLSTQEGGWWGDWSVWFEGDKWAKAYKIAEHRSPGQAIVLGAVTHNILDEEEVLRATNSQYYNWVTGSIDALFRFRVDVDVLGGKYLRRLRQSDAALTGKIPLIHPRSLITDADYQKAAAKNMDNFWRELGRMSSREVDPDNITKVTPYIEMFTRRNLEMGENAKVFSQWRHSMRQLLAPRTSASLAVGADPRRLELWLGSEKFNDRVWYPIHDLAEKAANEVGRGRYGNSWNDLTSAQKLAKTAGDSDFYDELASKLSGFYANVLTRDAAIGSRAGADNFTRLLGRKMAKRVSFTDGPIELRHADDWRPDLLDDITDPEMARQLLLEGQAPLGKKWRPDIANDILDDFRFFYGDNRTIEKLHNELIDVFETRKTLLGEQAKVRDFVDRWELFLDSAIPKLSENVQGFSNELHDFILRNVDEFPETIITDIIEESRRLGRTEVADLFENMRVNIEVLRRVGVDQRKIVRYVGSDFDEVMNTAKHDPRLSNPKFRREREAASNELRSQINREIRREKQMDLLAEQIAPTLSEAGNKARGYSAELNRALAQTNGELDELRRYWHRTTEPNVTLEDIVNQNVPVPVGVFDKPIDISSFDRRRYNTLLTDGQYGTVNQLFTGMQTHPIVDLADNQAHRQVSRMLEASPMDAAEQAAWLGRFNDAPTLYNREEVWGKIEDAIFESIAKDEGLTVGEIRYFLDSAKVGRHMAWRHLNKKENIIFEEDLAHNVLRIRSKSDMGGKAVLSIPMPRLTEQSLLVTSPDFRDLRRQLRRYGRWRKRHGDVFDDLGSYNSTEVPHAFVDSIDIYNTSGLNTANRWAHNGADMIMRAWVPAVLLRPAWAFRVVMMDEQIRQIAAFGGLVSFADQLRLKSASFKNFLHETVQDANLWTRMLGVDASLTPTAAARRSSIAGGLFGYAMTAGTSAPLIGMGVGALAGHKLVKYLNNIGHSPYSFARLNDGANIEASFGNALDKRYIEEEMINTRRSDNVGVLRMFGDTHYRRLNERMAIYGDGRTIRPTDVNVPNGSWGSAWETAMETFGSNPMTRRLAQIVQDQNAEAKRLIDLIEQARKRGDAKALENLHRDASSLLKNYDEVAAGKLTDLLQAERLKDPQLDDFIRSIGPRSYDDDAFEVWTHAITEEFMRLTRVDGGTLGMSEKVIDDIIAGRTPNHKDFIAEFRDPMQNLPSVNARLAGEINAMEGSAIRAVGEMVEDAFTLFQRLPTDTLSRQPTFAALYNLEARRIYGTLTETPSGHVVMNQASLDRLQAQARTYALNETRRIMYELAEQSNFAALTRFVMPFFPAWQEVITRYVGLAVENPVWAARVMTTWEGVNSTEFYEKDEETGDEYLRFPIPDWVKNVVINATFLEGAFDHQSEIRFNKKSFNMVAQGLPGFGPIVQIPLAEVVSRQPKLEETLEFMFPFGVPADTTDALLPSWARRFGSATGDEENRRLASMEKTILVNKITQMELGEIPMVDMDDPHARGVFLEEVQEEARKLMMLSSFASAVLPASPTFDSIYQDYIDHYKELQRIWGSRAADHMFIELYGEEYLALTQSFSRSMNGVPPTLLGIEQEERFGSLIQEYPELGGIIVGDEGGGSIPKFFRSKYNEQLETPIRPGSSTRQRVPLSTEDVALQATTKISWNRFSRYMDWIEAERIEAGYPNLRTKEASWLAEAKRSFIQTLAREDSNWAAEYFETDQLAWDRKLDGLRAIAMTPGLGMPDENGNYRDDLAPLNDYFALRDTFMAELDRRAANGGSRTLDSVGNTDLNNAWDHLLQEILAWNLGFADLWARTLENDPIRPPVVSGFPRSPVEALMGL